MTAITIRSVSHFHPHWSSFSATSSSSRQLPIPTSSTSPILSSTPSSTRSSVVSKSSQGSPPLHLLASCQSSFSSLVCILAWLSSPSCFRINLQSFLQMHYGRVLSSSISVHLNIKSILLFFLGWSSCLAFTSFLPSHKPPILPPTISCPRLLILAYLYIQTSDTPTHDLANRLQRALPPPSTPRQPQFTSSQGRLGQTALIWLGVPHLLFSLLGGPADERATSGFVSRKGRRRG